MISKNLLADNPEIGSLLAASLSRFQIDNKTIACTFAKLLAELAPAHDVTYFIESLWKQCPSFETEHTMLKARQYLLQAIEKSNTPVRDLQKYLFSKKHNASSFVADIYR